VVAHNLAPGTYQVLACGYVNTTAQDYTGKLTVTTAAASADGGEASLPSADPQGLSFSAAVPADPQRDESEPLIEIDRSGQHLHLRPDRLHERVRLRAGLDRRR